MIDKARIAKHVSSISLNKICTQAPRLAVMVGERGKKPPEETEFDTAELVTELKKPKTNYSQRKADSVDNIQPFKKQKR